METLNCIVIDDDAITRKVIETLIENSGFLRLKGSFPDAVSAMPSLGKKESHIVFLDVEMPEMSGFELLERSRGLIPIVIIITSHKKYAIDAFEFDVIDFLSKPVKPERFMKAVLKAQKQFALLKTGETDNAVYIKTPSQFVKIQPSDILFIRSLSDYVIIQTRSEKYTFHSTMKAMLGRLPSGEFLRVHHSYIIRLDKISRSENGFVYIGDYQLPVSRSKKSELNKYLKLVTGKAMYRK
jgi:DNA-binding LytR/AlgR family response regulator